MGPRANYPTKENPFDADTEGPLRDGKIERAAAWGWQIPTGV